MKRKLSPPWEAEKTSKFVGENINQVRWAWLRSTYNVTETETACPICPLQYRRTHFQISWSTYCDSYSWMTSALQHEVFAHSIFKPRDVEASLSDVLKLWGRPLYWQNCKKKAIITKNYYFLLILLILIISDRNFDFSSRCYCTSWILLNYKMIIKIQLAWFAI